MRAGLSAFGTMFDMGVHPKSGRPKIGARQLMDRACEYGLEGVELPLYALQVDDVSEIGRYARDRKLYVTVAASGYDPDQLSAALDLAAQVDAVTVRTVVGGARFGGDRRPLAGRWSLFMDEVHAGLRQAAETAERTGVNLAVENHQDLASEELLWLCESIGSPKFGVTLDAGNPLATAEEPIDFARRVGPYIKNVHLKDYYIYLSEEGYRLVRCPIGQGAVDFPALFRVLAEFCPDVPMSIEVGALEARHTRVLADDFWPDYPARSAAQLAGVLRFVQANAKPAGDWRTPYEREEPVEAIIAYERHQLAASVAYILSLLRESRQ